MASNKIQITLSSIFKGEGFTKAGNAVKGLSKEVKDATEGFGKLSGALGGMQGAVGKVAEGVGKLVGALSAGPIGIAIGGITLLVSAFNAWKEKTEEAAKKQRELAKQMEEGYRRRIAEAIEAAKKKQIEFLEATITKGKQALSVLEKLHNNGNVINQSNAEVRKAKGQNQLTDFDFETTQILNGKNGVEKDVTKAERALERVMLKNRIEAEEQAEAGADLAHAIGQLNDKITAQENVVNASIMAGKNVQEEELKLASLEAQRRAAENRYTIWEDSKLSNAKKREQEEFKAREELNEARKKAAKTLLDLDIQNMLLDANKKSLTQTPEQQRLTLATANFEAVKKRKGTMPDLEWQKQMIDAFKSVKDAQKSIDDKERKDRLDKNTKSLDELTKQTKDLKDKIQQENKNAWDNAQQNLTGDGRKKARNEAKEKRANDNKVQNRLKARDHQIERWSKEKPRLLSDNQKKAVADWRKRSDERKQVEKNEKKIKELQGNIDKDKQREQDQKDLPTNVKKILEELNKYLDLNGVK